MRGSVGQMKLRNCCVTDLDEELETRLGAGSAMEREIELETALEAVLGVERETDLERVSDRVVEIEPEVDAVGDKGMDRVGEFIID